MSPTTTIVCFHSHVVCININKDMFPPIGMKLLQYLTISTHQESDNLSTIIFASRCARSTSRSLPLESAYGCMTATHGRQQTALSKRSCIRYPCIECIFNCEPLPCVDYKEPMHFILNLL